MDRWLVLRPDQALQPERSNRARAALWSKPLQPRSQVMLAPASASQVMLAPVSASQVIQAPASAWSGLPAA